MRVLVVEDVAADAELDQREVRREHPDAEFLVVENREAYLAAIASFQPDIILSDYQLPCFDGMEALKLAMELAPDIPFIIVTGSLNEDTAAECMKAGAWDYVIKERLMRLVPAVRVALAEKRVRSERKKALAESARLATAIECAAEIIVITDPDGAIQYVNPAFVATTGYAREEVQGRTPRILRSGVQDLTFYREMWKTITAGTTWRGRFVNRKKDGTHYTEVATISPVHDAAGAITSFVAVKRDITHDLDIEAQLRQAQRMESIGRLAGGIAHDFNNLLSVIFSYTDFAIQQMPKEDPARKDLIEVRKAGDRAAALTRQLLAFSRRQVLQPIALDLNQAVRGVEKMLRRILGEDVEITLALASDLGIVRADSGQIEQVLMNLVVNARDAMPEGGNLAIETANVRIDGQEPQAIEACTPGEYVKLSVSDSGVGMDRETLGRIFEPFFTTKAIGKGTGLGLSTVYGIVKQSGGCVLVRSEPGQGTAFDIYLPRDAAAVADDTVPVLASARLTSGTEAVLLVEDEEVLRQAVSRSLAAAGYKVLAAADGEDALQVAATHAGEIHLLLTDVIMPRLGGRRLARELRKSRPNLKLLYMSGYADEVIAAEGEVDLGAQLIGKPFTPSELIRKVRAVLDGMGSLKQTGPHRAAFDPQNDGVTLASLPAVDLGRLRQAVAAARHDELLKIVESIRPAHPDAAALLDPLVDRLDYEGIRLLLRGS